VNEQQKQSSISTGELGRQERISLGSLAESAVHGEGVAINGRWVRCAETCCGVSRVGRQ